MPPGAYEVRIANTRARFCVSDNPPRTTVFAVKTALEEMRVLPDALTIYVGSKHLLHLLPQACAHDNWIYRGDIFLNITAEHLLYKGDHRKPEDRDRQKRARPAKGDTIEERPQEVADRETFGNWEMDSIIGCKGSKAALVVLTERLTRYPVIFRVPDHTMESVVRGLDRIERRMGAGFRQVFRSITVDNGSEFQDCAGMERSKRARKPRTKIYYCHPYSAYERGSNENMNRIIRRFFPKGTSFDEVTAAEVAEVEEWLANYPRRILGWETPQMLFERYIT